MTAHSLARQSTVLDLISEYDEKVAAVDAEVAAFKAAATKLEMASTIQGKFIAPVFRHGSPEPYAHDLKRNLLKSGWRAIYDRLQIDRIASAKDRRLFDQAIENPPELTFDNAAATFGDYLERPRHHILRGLAETFADLDPAYKSHSKVKIGVKCLPKRVILNNVGGWGHSHGSYGRDRLRDILNALAAYQGKTLLTHGELALILEDGDALRETSERPDPKQTVYERENDPKTVTVIGRDVWLKRYENGNGHLYFGPSALLDINRGLAEFYGEVLPDAEDDGVQPRASTAVSKDLQFYGSPQAVVERALSLAGIYSPREYSGKQEPLWVLEPSCGDGRILDEIRARGHLSMGIEVHAGRASEARAKRHDVLLSNFLDCPPNPRFDRVVMNPPFYGRHYVKHVQHALKFLKPGGILVSVLPATAWYDHGELHGDWTDLPVGSFSESGTNVPTGILRIRKPA